MWKTLQTDLGNLTLTLVAYAAVLSPLLLLDWTGAGDETWLFRSVVSPLLLLSW